MDKEYFLNEIKFSIPQLKEYLLVVNPGETVFEKVSAEKKAFSAAYKVSIAEKTKPHITVANFVAGEMMEERIITWLQKITSCHESFTVMLNNFSGFPSSKTVYARIQNHEPFRQLAASLKVINDYVKSNGLPAARIINHPHMSIARSLQQGVYDKAIMDYSQKTFNERFEVNELILLKRQHQYDKCKEVAVFKLMPAQTKAA